MSRIALVFVSVIIGGSAGALACLMCYGLDWILLHTCSDIPWGLLAIEGGGLGAATALMANSDQVCFKRIMAVVGSLVLLWASFTLVTWIFQIACYIAYAPSSSNAVYHVSSWEHLGEFIGTIIGVVLSIVLIDQVWKQSKERPFLFGTELSR